MVAMYGYIEVIQYGTEKVVKRLDVTGKTERNREKIEDGMNRNLNHSDFYTKVRISQDKLKTGDFN